MNEQTLEKTFAALAGEKHLDGIHLAGGEAMLNFPLLLDSVRAARRFGVRLEYLETNAAWALSEEVAREKFSLLQEAGLGAVLISATPFHNEFIPFERTRNAISAAREVFGHGVIVWLDSLGKHLARMDPTTCHWLEDFLEACPETSSPEDLRRLFPLTPGGRVVEELRHCYQARPAEAYRNSPCRSELSGVSHFHIDPQGCLFTGLCPGITAGDIEDFHPKITPETHPITTCLVQDGPVGLMERLGRQEGFTPRSEGYISKCDLCLHVRKHLRTRGDWSELRSEGFYADQGD
jgi:hypothetical protein